jgi:cation diffusion facilitator CzcD-associated flavoprotein CzcO
MIAQKQEWTTSNKNILDYIIIGSGPAGLQMGYFLQKQKQNFLILERGEKAGSFFQKFPRHGQLISSNKVYTGYNDRELISLNPNL